MNEVSANIVAIHMYRMTSKHVIESQHVTIHGAHVACHQRHVDIASAPDVHIVPTLSGILTHNLWRAHFIA